MRITRIDFTRVGAWTDRSLAFGPGLNLVTGANEAGKSTALRGIEALLFPVPAGGPHGLAELARPLAPGSFDATLHAARGQGAELETIGWRRWGTHLEDLKGQRLDPAIMRAWLWEITQQDYRLVYALGHDRLREGGKLLEKDGAVSTIIADLTGGVRGLPELRATLVKRRDHQYLMGGNATRVLNTALGELRTLATRRMEQERRQEHERYLSLLGERDGAKAGVRRKGEEIKSFEKQIKSLAELKFAPPRIAEVMELGAQQEQLAISSAMPTRAWFERACDLETAFSEATRKAGAAADRLRSATLALDGRAPSAPVLAASGEIAAALAWTKDFEEYETKLQEATRWRDDEFRALSSILVDLGVTGSRDEVVGAASTFRIDNRRKTSLVAALKAAEKAREATERATTAVETEEKALAERERVLVELPAPAPLGALRDARELGQLDEAESEASTRRQAVSTADERLHRVARRLGFPAGRTLAECASTAVPPAVETDALDAERHELTTRSAVVEVNVKQAQTDEKEARRQLDTFDGLLDPTLNRDALARLRAERDALEAKLVSGTGGASSGDALRELGAAIRKIDALVDRLLDHAKLVADRVAAERALDLAGDAVSRAKEAVQGYERDRDDLASRWRRLWSASGLTVAHGDTRWRDDYRRFVEDFERLKDLEGEANAADEKARSIRVAVETALEGIERGLAAPALDRRLAEAIRDRDEAIKVYDLATSQVDEAKRRCARARDELSDAETRRADAETGLAQLAAAAPTLVAGDPDRVEAWIGRVDALDHASQALQKALDADKALRDRHKQALDAVARAFKVLAAGGVHPGTAIDVPLLLRLNTLSELLEAAKKTYEREITAKGAEDELAGMAREEQSALETLASHLGDATGERVAPDAQAVALLMQRVRDYYAADAKIADIKRSACQGRGLDWEALVAQVGGRDISALDADIEAIAERKEIVAGEIGTLERRIADIEGELGDLTRDGSVAELSQQIERLIAATAEDLEETLALFGAVALLEEVDAQLSEDARLADLLAAASLHFARLTRGMFARVEFKDAQRKELVVVRAGAGGESTLDPQALSDGTRDQLWLALRLALIEPHLSAKRLPLVLDDILVHFDPARTIAALEALAEIARHTQVILFTHHPHVVELARAAGLDFEALDLPAREALGAAPPREALDPSVPRPRAVRPRPVSEIYEAVRDGEVFAHGIPNGGEPISADAQILRETLAAKDDRRSGNIKLKGELGWTDERYSHAKEELVSRGLARVGTGRGGSLRLASAGDAVDETTPVDEM
jgi:uncharacterized protein YhaN